MHDVPVQWLHQIVLDEVFLQDDVLDSGEDEADVLSV